MGGGAPYLPGSFSALCVCIMGPLYGGEATAAVALGLTVANLGRSTVLPASEPVAVSAEGCEFVEQLLPRAELQEHRVQEVRQHHVPTLYIDCTAGAGQSRRSSPMEHP